MKAEHRQKIEFKQAQKLLESHNNQIDDSRSVASSHRSRKHRDRDADGVSRPPLTNRALTHIDEGSVVSSRRGSRSHHGHGSRRGSVIGDRERERHSGGDRERYSGGERENERYRHSYMEEAAMSQPHLSRRHTDYPGPMETQLTLRPPMPMQQHHHHGESVARSASDPDLRHGRDNIDMNLAYGDMPLDIMNSPTISEEDKEIELQATMTKLDHLLLEAHCVQHSATAIIKNLQDNPEAMAAVALTLAEISNLLKKCSPAILMAMKSSSPAVFALLASPQFLIAGGLALGVTVVMFGGYKIVKKIQESAAAKKEEPHVEEALVWNPSEVGSIETWRRGIESGGQEEDNTSVDGEFITPEAARQRKERVRERRREERTDGHRAAGGSVMGESVRSERTVRRVGSDRTLRTVGSESTLRRRPKPTRAKTELSVSGRSVKAREVVEVKEKKKSSTLSVIFSKKTKEEKEKKKDKKEGKSRRGTVIDV